MTTKEINCPRCGKPLDYWTLGDFIECTGCKEQIQVEPCEPDEPSDQSTKIESPGSQIEHIELHV